MIFVRGTSNMTIEKPASEEALMAVICEAEQAHPEQLQLSVNGAPLEFATLAENQTIEVAGKLFGGKVKGQTPRVEAEEKRKRKTGRAAKRAQYNARFVTTSSAFSGKRVGPNNQADRVAKA